MMQIVRHHLRPEFVNRIDEIIVFRALDKVQIGEIARLLLDPTARRLRAQGIEVEFTGGAVGLIAEDGFDPEFGARPLRVTIQRRVDNELASMVLSGSLEPRREGGGRCRGRKPRLRDPRGGRRWRERWG